jgi:signal transduction histidine kinase/ActR/RegA family two-component response regulator
MAKIVAARAAPARAPRARRSLRARLDEAEQSLAAIRAGEVDAVVVGGPSGDRIYTLEGAEHSYRVLMEAMSEGVATVTQQGIVTYCNVRFAAILGARLELTIGNPIARFLPEGGWGELKALLVAGTEGRGESELWLKAPCANAPALVRLAVVAMRLDGALTHCLVMTDLTEQRRQAVAIAAERAQMQARLLLVDRMSSLGTLAAGVAHEINNPLAYVVTSLELMKSRLQDATAATQGVGSEPTEWLRRQLARASEGVERVRLIVRDLKAFSRPDEETMGVVDPRRALDTSIALASNEISHRARLVRDYDALPPVWANEAHLGQLFLHLLLNAAQAIAPGAAADNEIRVSGRTDCEGRAVIEVRDTGSGIDTAHLNLVFDPFFTTKPQHEGTGLGLSFCHSIVASLDGQITVKSERGEGSVFRVLLPGIALATSTAPSFTEPTPAVVQPLANRRGQILVIDDEPDICLALEEALQRSHDVVTTTEAVRALDLLAAGQRFHLILCDVRMPRMTGLDFYARLTALDPSQARRVVLMSGAFSRRPGDPALVLPAPVLEKPFGVDRVLSLLHESMRTELSASRTPKGDSV